MWLRQAERIQKPIEEQQQRLAFVQIKQDFERMQSVNNQMMRTVFADGALDYKLISRTAGEIRKRAARLKDNLVLPHPEDKNEQGRSYSEPGAPHIKSSLSTLDDLIMGFVNNPVFRNTGVVDAKLSLKARRDLEGIIELSAKIKRSAERIQEDQR